MHTSPRRADGFALSLAALGLVALAPTVAHAQTQDMFVSNRSSNTISRFAGTGPGTFSTTATTLSGNLDAPVGLAFNAHGDLFVADKFGGKGGGGSITEFAAGATPGSLGTGAIFATGFASPSGLAVDSHGNLFVANNAADRITEFASLGAGMFGTAQTIATGQHSPQGLAVNANGDLFVVNGDGDTITDFTSMSGGTFAPGKIIATGLFGANGLAVDAQGNLFLSNSFKVIEFASVSGGTFASGKTIGIGLTQGYGVAFDAAGNLFAVNYGSNAIGSDGSITEFSFDSVTGTFGTGKTVETGLSGPTFVTFSPIAPPAVPEASTTASLGLLLALGMGGVAVARKRRKA